MRIRRLAGNPLLTSDMVDFSELDHHGQGPNLDCPFLVRVPDWVPNPLGRYYLYFAHHHGDRIGLAYSDSLDGPYTVHRSLAASDSAPADSCARPEGLREGHVGRGGRDRPEVRTTGPTPIRNIRLKASPASTRNACKTGG
ncbi:MAG: hypothetical protein R6X33_03915 [Candidatus Brocadiia bacterium]